MDPRHLFSDQRNLDLCVYCGNEPTTKDHVPSRVLLDEPYPPNIPVLDACESCNASFSKDEQYVACLIECAWSGSAQPADVRREKIRRILTENSALASHLADCCKADNAGVLVWQADVDRVRNVVLKLARGHVAYELSEPRLNAPDSIAFQPISTLTVDQRENFESLSSESLLMPWPEIGSRAFIRALREVAGRPIGWPTFEANGWLTVQPGRYRYIVTYHNGVVARMVLSEYLACMVAWE